MNLIFNIHKKKSNQTYLDQFLIHKFIQIQTLSFLHPSNPNPNSTHKLRTLILILNPQIPPTQISPQTPQIHIISIRKNSLFFKLIKICIHIFIYPFYYIFIFLFYFLPCFFYKFFLSS